MNVINAPQSKVSDLKVVHKGDIGRDLFQDRMTSLSPNCQIICKRRGICAYCPRPVLSDHTSFELTLKINFKTLQVRII